MRGTPESGRLGRWAAFGRLCLRHPLFVLRSLGPVRALIRLADRPVARRLPGIAFPLYLRLGPNIALFLGRLAEAPERAHFKRLAAAVEPPVFWDVGANVGTYLATFLTRRPEGRALAVEPDPANLACLRRSLARSPGLAAEVVPAACAERCGRAVFRPDEVSGATGSLASDEVDFASRYYRARTAPLEVETITLDELLARHGAPALVKVDVEGAELRVLAGGTRLLREVRPLLLMETYTHRAEVEAVLAAADYGWVDAVTLADQPETANVFAFPAEQKARWLAVLRQTSD